MSPLKRLALAVCVISLALPEIAYGFKVRVSAYAPVPRCTKKIHPDVTASGCRICSADYGRAIALSHDLAKKYTFGDLFFLEVNGKKLIVEYLDRMPRKGRKKKVDFLLSSVEECIQFGLQEGELTLIRGDGREDNMKLKDATLEAGDCSIYRSLCPLT
jgi:hypothetical protein